ncbi:MAG: rhodanese-like domain-containing protein [Chloroflexi bacterium]|nr:rhodanese-like domain-containing protein [Chloroflexota bacterium]
MSTIILTVAMAAVLAACGKAEKTSPAASDDVKRIEVEGGAFQDVMPARLNEMLKKKDFVFINVHVPYQGEIANTDLFIPYDRIQDQPSQLPKDKKAKIVLYCRSGYMSALAAQTLVKLNYSNVGSLHGGMDLWEKDGYPLQTVSR